MRHKMEKTMKKLTIILLTLTLTFALTAFADGDQTTDKRCQNQTTCVVTESEQETFDFDLKKIWEMFFE
jgi:hypothetical protein